MVSTVAVASARPSASRFSCWRGVAGLAFGATAVLAGVAVLVAAVALALPGAGEADWGPAASAVPAPAASTSRKSRAGPAAQ